MAPVVTATSIILRSDGMQNAKANLIDWLIQAHLAKWLLKQKVMMVVVVVVVVEVVAVNLLFFLFPGADREVIESISKADIRVHRRVMNRLAVSKLKLLMMEIIKTRSLGMHALNLQ